MARLYVTVKLYNTLCSSYSKQCVSRRRDGNVGAAAFYGFGGDATRVTLGAAADRYQGG